MNIFIIHSGLDYTKADSVKNELKDNCKRANVLLLEYRKLWKPEAKKLMKDAQIILFIVGKESYLSRNINWELKKALKMDKGIVIYKLYPECKLNKSLMVKDPFTKEEKCIAEEVKNTEELIKIINSYENDEYISLLNENVENDNLFEQYKMFAETSEALVDRRQTVNSFYITANTALMTIAATAFSLNTDWLIRLIITIALTVPGILLNVSWRRILESYGLINKSKMKILGMLEKKLSASLYDAEWQAMSHKYNKSQYISFTDSEKGIPRIFNGVYFVIDAACFITLAYMYWF